MMCFKNHEVKKKLSVAMSYEEDALWSVSVAGHLMTNNVQKKE